ncbi:hypothetical protein D9M70_620200 [compost metagenome]
MQHATGLELLREGLRAAGVVPGEVLVVPVLVLLLGVEVVEVAEELVEAVHGGQVGVVVAEVVLAELAGAVAGALEHFGQAR